SIMSVSRAMRGVEGVSAAKRAEILRVANRMGYRPNRMAGSLAAANSTLIGVSVPTLFDAVFAEIFDGMRAAFISAGFQTVIETTEYFEDREEQWVERMISWHPAGIILSGVHHSDGTRSKLAEARIPVLEIWDHSDEPIDLCVGINHNLAGYEMGQYLLNLGYRRPAYVGVEHNRDRRAEGRFDGLQKAFAEAGVALVTNTRIASRPSFEAGLAGVERVLNEADEPPDIIYFLNDHMAFGGMMACERYGLPVPERVAIVGFNGLNINAVLRKKITTSVTPRHQMGAKAAQMIVAKIFGARTDRHVQMPVEIFAGQTTRRPSG
ncbi:MAG: LacI family DNA-binding transcriptional regulator, partial [Pseudomonadota bacterium]